jgi:hypothetical protein
MSRDVRALGRELRPELTPIRRPVLRVAAGWLVRHLPELLIAYLLVRAWLWVADRVGAQWTVVATVALAGGILGWQPSRRLLLALGGCVVTRARLRKALAELRLSGRDGRPPVVLGMIPTRTGERVWLLCPVGIAAADIDDETDRLAAACFARDTRVAEHRRWSAVVVLDVLRRAPREHRPERAAVAVRTTPYRPPVTRMPVQVARHRA